MPEPLPTPSSVDAGRVVDRLQQRLADEVIRATIAEVALDQERERSAVLEARVGELERHVAAEASSDSVSPGIPSGG